MSWILGLALLTAIGLLVYLVVALLNPELFS
jgi:K+-transporting ATPase KdpF subunit